MSKSVSFCNYKRSDFQVKNLCISHRYFDPRARHNCFYLTTRSLVTCRRTVVNDQLVALDHFIQSRPFPFAVIQFTCATSSSLCRDISLLLRYFRIQTTSFLLVLDVLDTPTFVDCLLLTGFITIDEHSHYKGQLASQDPSFSD